MPKRKLRILTVGDGDLTFSLSLVRCLGTSQLDLTATVLQSTEDELIRTYSNSKDVLRELREEWNVAVLFGVDAARLDSNEWPASSSSGGGTIEFDCIIFNHPHLGRSLLDDNQEKAHALRHRSLLAHYFHSSSKFVSENGIIHLCLCGNQPNAWGVMDAASRNNLHSIDQCSTSGPITRWLSLASSSVDLEILPAQEGYSAPRRYRNGKLGSRHFLAKYGYRHRRTEGDLTQKNCSDMNVENSVNLLFQKRTITDRKAQKRSRKEELIFHCSICDRSFPSNDKLQGHFESPSLPDAMPPPLSSHQARNDKNDVKTRRGSSPSLLQNESLISPKKAYSCVIPVDTPHKIKIKATSSVGAEYGGTRLRKYCMSHFHCSKKNSQEQIVRGRILVNGTVAYDSSRIVRSGDIVSLVEDGALESPSSERFDAVKILTLHNHPKLIVAFKATGTRTCGTFSPDTLEMVVSTQLKCKFEALSMLETGCTGLVCCKPSEMGKQLTNTIIIRYKFTCLVFCSVPDEWSQAGIYVDIPKDSVRRWNRSGDRDRDDGGDANDGSTTFAFVTRNTADDPSQELHIKCVERCTATGMNVSTVEIASSANNGRLCGIICYVLRKLGHGVVNDRFQRKEFAALPRAVRNRLKKKLCIGCYSLCIKGDDQEDEENVRVDIPSLLRASYWQDFLSSSP